MMLRLGMRILPLFVLFGVALWFHAELTNREGRRHTRASSSDVLNLYAGGSAPHLKLPEPGRSKQGKPTSPDAPPRAEPEPEPEKVVLREGDTLHAVCVRVHGNARRLGEVLDFNGLSEEAARRLRPGMTVLVPR
jgi:hypothetical protein